MSQQYVNHKFSVHSCAVLAFLLMPVFPDYCACEAQDEGKLTFNIEKRTDSSRMGLDYSLKWSTFSIYGIGSALKEVLLEKDRRWDITENTRLNYYGVRVNPWRIIIENNSRKPQQTLSDGGGTNSAAVSKKPGKNRRVRLSLTPLVDSVVENADEDIRNLILNESFKNASPELAGAGRNEKKQLFGDVLKLGVMEHDLPVIRETRGLFEFVRGKENSVYSVAPSTASFVFNGVEK